MSILPTHTSAKRVLALSLASVVAALATADAQDADPPAFTDWTAASSVTDTASGTLRGVPVHLSGPEVQVGILDGTFTGFASSWFAPALATSDTVALGAQGSGGQFRIAFGAP